VVGLSVETGAEPALEPIRHGHSGRAMRAGGILSGPVPLALRLVAPRSATARRLAAISTIAGSLLTRFEWLDAGRESARAPAGGALQRPSTEPRLL
jgi:hypothetical protein